MIDIIYWHDRLLNSKNSKFVNSRISERQFVMCWNIIRFSDNFKAYTNKKNNWIPLVKIIVLSANWCGMNSHRESVKYLEWPLTLSLSIFVAHFILSLRGQIKTQRELRDRLAIFLPRSHQAAFFSTYRYTRVHAYISGELVKSALPALKEIIRRCFCILNGYKFNRNLSREWILLLVLRIDPIRWFGYKRISLLNVRRIFLTLYW